jgi:hypothetical protein
MDKPSMPTATKNAEINVKWPVMASDSLEAVITAFNDLRACLADLLIVVQADPTKTRESARLLGLNRGLVWRLTRMVRSNDFAATVSDVPARASMSRFITACRERGAPEVKLLATAEALDEFERAVGRCSGDRKTLSMLMANRRGNLESSEQEKARRKMFDGGCAVWGVQAQVRFVSVFLFPAADDRSRIDVGHVTGYVGFRRLRAIPWPMSYEAVRSAGGRAVSFEKRPLDPAGSTEGRAQLLAQFSEPGVPEINVVTNGDMKRFELAAGPVGNAGVATCVFGTYLRHLYPRVESADHRYASFTVLLETPVERVIFDMFVHRDIALDALPTAHLCEKLTHPHAPSDAEMDTRSLPLAESPFALGQGASGALTPHIAWYPRLVNFVAEKIGHAPEEFNGSRFEMTYPPIPTALVRRFPLEAAGAKR